MAGSYKDFLEGIAPSWLLTPRAKRWIRAVGDGADALLGPLKEAVRARMPLVAPEDALAAIGSERGIARGTTESAASYAARLAEAWETWPWAGTPYGMLRAFRAAGYTNVALEIVGGRQFTLDANGALVVTGLPAGSWAVDATPVFWSKFQVLFLQPLPAGWSITYTPGPVTQLVATGAPTAPTAAFSDQTREGFTLLIEIVAGGATGVATFRYSANNGLTWSAPVATGAAVLVPAPYGLILGFAGNYTALDRWSCTVTVSSNPAPNSGVAQSIRALVAQWKPAHATCAGIVLQGAGSMWGYPHVGATWDTPAETWGGNSSALWTFP